MFAGMMSCHCGDAAELSYHTQAGFITKLLPFLLLTCNEFVLCEINIE